MSDFAVFITTYKGDFHLAKLACQSVRHHCGPEVPIVLIKDGGFDSLQIECVGNISEFDRGKAPAELRNLSGWGIPKLLAFFQKDHKRFLLLDADTALVSHPFRISTNDAEFVVDPYEERDRPADFRDWARAGIFDLDRISQYDRRFSLDNVVLFNSGQIYGTAGLLPLKETLAALDQWNRQTGLFSADQGILNYLFNKGHQEGWWNLKPDKFKIGAGYEPESRFPGLTVSSLRAKRYNERVVIHWAGVKRHRLSELPYAFVAQEFQSQYYDRLPPHARYLDEAGRSAAYCRRKLRDFVKSATRH
ncbi:MAG TPA: putative nucleotide-diphospho-sugar transferase [Blastocatellia bacterium]